MRDFFGWDFNGVRRGLENDCFIISDIEGNGEKGWDWGIVLNLKGKS